MNVLFITIDYPPNRFIGAELYDHAIAKYLIKTGNKVFVYTSNTNEEYFYENVHVNPKNTIVPDLILSHVDGYYLVEPIILAKGWQNVAHVAIQHNLTVSTLIQEQKQNRWQGIIYNSTYMQENSSNNNVEKLTIIPPVPTPVKKVNQNKSGVLQIGLTPEKGSAQFYGAAVLNPNIQFTGVAGGWGKNYYYRYPNVTFLPQQEDLSNLLDSVEFLFLPSQFESWAMIASEAIAHGTTVVTWADLPGVRENLGDSAYYVNRGNAFGLVLKKITPKTEESIKQAKINRKRHLDSIKELTPFLKNMI